MADQCCKSEPRSVIRPTSVGYYQQEEVLQKLGSRALALHGAGDDEVGDTADALWDTQATHEFMVQMVREILPDGKNVTAERIEDYLVEVSLNLANLLVAERQLRLENSRKSTAAESPETPIFLDRPRVSHLFHTGPADDWLGRIMEWRSSLRGRGALLFRLQNSGSTQVPEACYRPVAG